MAYRIPRRIIQTAKSLSQPLRNRAFMANLRLLNPDFEFLFFDDRGVEDFLAREFPEYRTVFDSFQYPIQRYDFFRYLAIYRYGGFYFDLDVLLASGLSSLCELDCVFPFEGLTLSRYLRDAYHMDWELGNYAFGAMPGHPFIKAVIENCVKGQQEPAWVKPMMRGSPSVLRAEYFVLNSTGPGLLSRTFAANPDLARNVTVLFPDDVCDSDYWNRFGELGVHLMEGSWRLKANLFTRKLGLYLESRKMKRLMRRSRQLGPQRHFPPSPA
jgi:hypothetical protein